MPITVASQLNKRINARYAVTERVPPYVGVAAYSHAVSEPKGISVTGYEVLIEVDPATDIAPTNGIIVELLENVAFPTDQPGAVALIYDQTEINNAIFKAGQSFGTWFGSMARQFTAPLQLRYGLTYSFYARAMNLNPPAGAVSIDLTIFGYQNADEAGQQPVITLR